MALDQPCKRRLGVFGGTFDPIHTGHLAVASEAMNALQLDRVLFVPARVSPLKRRGTCFTAQERLDMVRLATESNPRFDVSSIDLDREGLSFTVETLRLIREQERGLCELFFLMGRDSLLTFHHWRGPREILSLARLAVVNRPGSVIDLAALDSGIPGLSDAVDLVDTIEIGVSSTEIRERIAEGRPIRYLVPEPVYAYLQEKGARC